MSEQIRAVEAEDTSAVAHKLASQALRDEEAHRQEARKRLGRAAKVKREEATGKVRLEDGRMVEPLATYMQSATEDFTSIPDEFIKRNEHGKFHVRWVRKRDLFGDRSDTEIGYYQRFGFEVINKADGRPYERRELIAMQGPPEGFAALLARNAKPGSEVYDRAFEALEDLADRTNRRAGQRVVDIVTSEDHGPEHPNKVMF